jgi:ADP-heptose:LPS heptosyltransferase
MTNKAKSSLDRILVIKLGAIGDFFLAMPVFQAIRRHHPEAQITLLTTAPFKDLAERSGWFDSVRIDDRPKYNPLAWLRQLRMLNSGFDFVYDLQTSGRSNFYYKLFLKKPEWSGNAKGCSHPDPTPVRRAVHSFELRRAQLKTTGIEDVPFADLSWLTNGDRYRQPGRTVLLVPGAAAHRPEKRWPAGHYAALAVDLEKQGFIPVVIGGKDEAETARLIALTAPRTIDLTTRTTFFDIADLARDATTAIGNDTGPMHLIAAIGCPALVLFSSASDPHHSAPRGKDVRILQRDDLAALGVAEVQAALADILAP